MHLPTPAVLLTAVYTAALVVAVASAAAGSPREALAGLVVLTALVVRGVLRRSRRAAPTTVAAVATVDAALPTALPDALPEAAPVVRTA